MERLIDWVTGCHDEIELVYKKGELNSNVGQLFFDLEKQALQEAEDNCSLIKAGGKAITHEEYLHMSKADIEGVIYILGNAGLSEFSPSMTEPIITVTLTPIIPKVQACTMFNLINRIEKIDGAYNEVFFSKASLLIQAPLGGKKGLMKWYMLIMQLYHWLSVKETSTNQIAIQ